jgi:hypothetical protein
MRGSSLVLNAAWKRVIVFERRTVKPISIICSVVKCRARSA